MVEQLARIVRVHKAEDAKVGRVIRTHPLSLAVLLTTTASSYPAQVVADEARARGVLRLQACAIRRNSPRGLGQFADGPRLAAATGVRPRAVGAQPGSGDARAERRRDESVDPVEGGYK